MVGEQVNGSRMGKVGGKEKNTSAVIIIFSLNIFKSHF